MRTRSETQLLLTGTWETTAHFSPAVHVAKPIRLKRRKATKRQEPGGTRETPIGHSVPVVHCPCRHVHRNPRRPCAHNSGASLRRLHDRFDRHGPRRCQAFSLTARSSNCSLYSGRCARCHGGTNSLRERFCRQCSVSVRFNCLYEGAKAQQAPNATFELAAQLLIVASHEPRARG